VPVRALAEATGLSVAYCGKITRGEVCRIRCGGRRSGRQVDQALPWRHSDEGSSRDARPLRRTRSARACSSGNGLAVTRGPRPSTASVELERGALARPVPELHDELSTRPGPTAAAGSSSGMSCARAPTAARPRRRSCLERSSQAWRSTRRRGSRVRPLTCPGHTLSEPAPSYQLNFGRRSLIGIPSSDVRMISGFTSSRTGKGGALLPVRCGTSDAGR
jgi:hypothetical protein